MNLSNLPTPKLPRREPWHDDDYYALLLKAYCSRQSWRPVEFSRVVEAREMLRELKDDD